MSLKGRKLLHQQADCSGPVWQHGGELERPRADTDAMVICEDVLVRGEGGRLLETQSGGWAGSETGEGERGKREGGGDRERE